jgi:hypothetical protein
LWKGALVLVAVLLPLLLSKISGPLDVHFPEILKNLSLGAGGVGSAFAAAAIMKVLWQLIEDKVTSKSGRDETGMKQHL